MNPQISNPSKWEATVSVDLAKAKPDEIWPLFTDFFGLDKWLPTVDTCQGVEGTNGEPGGIRICSGSSIGSGGSTIPWAKERLVDVNHVNRSMSYEILETNTGLESYKSTIRVLPAATAANVGCRIEWSFAVDPVRGWVFEDLVKIYENGLRVMSKKMEDSLLQN